MNPFDDEYHTLIRNILATGGTQTDRTGTGTLEVFGAMLKFDLSDGTVPAMTSKKLAWKTVFKELLWLISGNTNVRPLVEQGVHIWSEWPCKHWLRSTGQTIPAQDDKAGWKDAVARFEHEILKHSGFSKQWGDMGPIYGKQWRRWQGPNGTIDQLARAIDTIRKKPHDRRIIVSAWNVGDIPDMEIAGLPPCHNMYQFNVRDGALSLLINQRSCDMFLGVPFNILSYAALLCLVAHVTDLKRGELTWVGGSCHIYSNHMEQFSEQLSRTSFPPPILRLNEAVKEIDDFKFDDLMLDDYQSHATITAPIAV